MKLRRVSIGSRLMKQRIESRELVKIKAMCNGQCSAHGTKYHGIPMVPKLSTYHVDFLVVRYLPPG